MNEAAFSLIRAGGYYPSAPGDAANLPNDSITAIGAGFGQAARTRYQQHNNFVIHDGLKRKDANQFSEGWN